MKREICSFSLMDDRRLGSAQISFGNILRLQDTIPDGTPDTTFDGDGLLQMRAPGSLTNNDSGVNIARQSDGSLLTEQGGYVYRLMPPVSLICHSTEPDVRHTCRRLSRLLCSLMGEYWQGASILVHSL